MKTKNITHKLNACIASVVFTIIIYSTNAQIIYTDIIPDSTVSATVSQVWVEYYLDLNNNGTTDFTLIQMNTGLNQYQKVEMTSAGSLSEVLADTTGWMSHPLALSQNQSIDDNQAVWYTSPSICIHLNGDGAEGYWIGVQDKYLGLRFKINNQWHYGWARLDIPADATYFTIKDYAYNSVPNQGISAGDMGTGIKEKELLSNVNVYAYNKTLFVDLKDNNITDGIIKLYNMAGQQVKSIAIINAKMEININDVPYGIYFIKTFTDDKLFIEKIMLE